MRILQSGLCALVILGLSTNVSATDPKLTIVSAEVSATGTTLFVSGSNFGRSRRHSSSTMRWMPPGSAARCRDLARCSRAWPGAA